jgi:hypothetical protein
MMGDRGDSPYATPRNVTDLTDCAFYHTIEIPEHGVIKGDWDLRGMERTYLGHVDLSNRRVLEVGPGSGGLSFFMEREGAEVICYELAEDESRDYVPYVSKDWDLDRVRAGNKEWTRRQSNSFWFAHRAFGSKVRVAYGSAYRTPEPVGPVHIATFGNVLLHLRDPFLALQQILRLTTETVIVTETIADPFVTPVPRFLRRFKLVRDMAKRGNWPVKFYNVLAKESMLFLPRYSELKPEGTWWGLTPRIVQQFVGVLGFRRSAVSYHVQRYREVDLIPQFTVVASRTDHS